MKAVVYEQYGPPEVLRVKEVDKPVPQDNELLIKVTAAEATKADCELRSFRFPVKWFWLPLRFAVGLRKPRRPVLGGYLAGEVEAVGKNVSKFSAGDQIFGTANLRLGGYGEYVCLPDSYTLVSKPINQRFTEAAAVPMGGLNALHFMTRADIQPGDKVLVIGAGGSIGLFAVQIAKTMGAEVTAVDSTLKQAMLLDIGADHFIDYRQTDFAGTNQTYDVIFSVIVQKEYDKCIHALKPKGRYILANPRLRDMIRSVFTSRLTDKKTIFAFAKETEEELRQLKSMIEAGQIRSIVDKVYAFDQATEAHRRVETEQRLGSVVISAAGAHN